MTARRASLSAVSGSARIRGFTASGKRSYEKKTPEQSHIPGGWLVEKEDVGLSHQRARDRQPLLLPSRELSHAGVSLFIERQIAQQLIGIVTALVERSKQPQRLVDRQLLVELRFLQRDTDALAQLCRIAVPRKAEDFDLAAIRLRQPLEDLDGGRLSGAIRPQKTKALATGNEEVEPVDSLDVRVVLAQVAA